jgi:hypothetical protein
MGATCFSFFFFLPPPYPGMKCILQYTSGIIARSTIVNLYRPRTPGLVHPFKVGIVQNAPYPERCDHLNSWYTHVEA